MYGVLSASVDHAFEGPLILAAVFLDTRPASPSLSVCQPRSMDAAIKYTTFVKDVFR